MFDCIVNADAPYPRFLSAQALELIQKVGTAGVQNQASAAHSLRVQPLPLGTPAQPLGVPVGYPECTPAPCPAPPEVPRAAPGRWRAGCGGDQDPAILQGKWLTWQPHCLAGWRPGVTLEAALPTDSTTSILAPRPPTGRPCWPAPCSPPSCPPSAALQTYATSRASSRGCRLP